MPRMTFHPDTYRLAIEFAAGSHGQQRVPGTELTYVVHLASVAAEVLAAAAVEPFDADFAVTCALLHDTLEDTGAAEEEIERRFGARVARGVRALSKDPRLPTKAEQMADSLARITHEPREVWIVKLADRISNLAAPPAYWTREKRSLYREEARQILATLGAASAHLAARLEAKIEAYGAYIDEPR
jgi:(p)ppGpp synthase/HD superfamily hydrolase